MKHRSSRLAARIGLAIGAVLLAVGGPELALRAAGHGPSLERDEMPADPDTLWTLLPGAGRRMGREVHINHLGLQGPEPAAAPVRRVLATGDSSVFGVSIGPAPAFPAVLGAALGEGFEVHNGGTPGYSSTQSLVQTRRVWSELQPELLVVANLWSDNNFDSFVDDEALAAAASPRNRLAHAVARGAQHSALLSTLWRRGSLADQEVVAWGQAGQETFGGRRRVPPDRYRANLEAFVDLAREHDAGVVFVVLPNTEDLRSEARPWPWDPYRWIMRDVATQRGCPIVEGPAAIAGLGPGAFVDDMHPSAAGHDRLGRALVESVRASGWTEGAALCRGGGGPGPIPDDPWTWPEEQPPSADRPTVAGLVVGNPARREQLHVDLVGPDGDLLDRVELPAAAPFALQADPPPTRATVRVRQQQGGRVVGERAVDLASGAAWGVDLALPESGLPGPPGPPGPPR